MRPSLSQHCSSTDEHPLIDAVYLWCDGADPEFKKAKEKRLKELGLPWQEDNVGDLRYADNDELKHSFRSLWKNAPWINHVWLVTNRQRPSWLRDHPKLTIIDHREIIPESLLPTFNSVVIENYVHKIPGLQEKFLLFNDDMFLKNPVNPEFFFSGDLPIVRLRTAKNFLKYKSTKEIEAAIDDHLEPAFRETQLRAWVMVCRRHGYSKPFVLSHTVDGLTKSAIETTLERYPDILKKNVTPFRTGEEVQRLIFQLEMVRGMGAPVKIIPRLSFWLKHFGFLFPSKAESFEGTESNKARRRIKTLNPYMFCLNADIRMDPKNRRKSRNFLNELFPEPSPFEAQ